MPDQHPNPAPPGPPVDASAEVAAMLAILRGTNHLMVLVAADGTVKWTSPSVTTVLGYERSELIGESVLTFLHPDDLPLLIELLTWSSTVPMDGGLERDDASTAFDLRLRHKTGRWVTIEALANNFLAVPEIEAHLAVGRDVTARRAMDDALTALAEGVSFTEGVLRLLAFLELRVTGVSCALWWPGNVPAWTTQSVPESLLGPNGPWRDARPDAGLLVLEDLEAAVADGHLPDDLAAAARRAGFTACWCIPIPRASEPDMWGSARARSHAHVSGVLVVWSRIQPAPLFGHHFAIDRTCAFLHFAMARHKLDADRLVQIQREQAEKLRLQELDAVRTQVALAASHDLRTPLTSIVSAAQLLRGAVETLSPQDRACVEIIDRNATRLLGLVKDLSLLTRMVASEVPDTQPVDMAALVRNCSDDIWAQVEAKGLNMEVTVSDGPPLAGDPHRLEQLVNNLLSNAIRYTEPGGDLRLTVRPDDDGWVLTVADTGIGVPPPEQEQVFEPFTRGSNVTRDHVDGSGLGLVIVRAVADLHRGSVTLDSQEGVGSTFTVELRNIKA